MEKNVLIIGSSAKEYALAKKFSEIDYVKKVYVAPGNDAMAEFAEVIDIRESDTGALIEFAVENAIDLTVVCSENTIKDDIATEFNKNNLMIFAPTADSALVATSKSFAKKFIYKLRIPTPKFGIYEKQNLAIDYARNARYPIVIKTDEHRGVNGSLICNAFSVAKSFIEETFLRGEDKVIIEDYIYGQEFSFYVVTDGYEALPLSSVANYKFSLDGDGGLLTRGMGSCVPNYKISSEIEKILMEQVFYPVLDTLAQQGTPYVGILGVDAVLTPENDIVTLEMNTFMQDHDCQGILSLLNEDLYKLFEACIIGSFADDYKYIDIANDYAVSCVLSSGNIKGSVIEGLNAIDEDTKIAHFNTKKNRYLEYETTGGSALLVTSNAKTVSRAVERMYDEVALINFDGKKYRKDLCSVIVK